MKLKLFKLGDAPSDLSNIIHAAMECPSQYDIIVVAHNPNTAATQKPTLYLERLSDTSGNEMPSALRALTKIIGQNMTAYDPKST